MSKARENIFKAVTAQLPTAFDEVVEAVNRFNSMWEQYLREETPYWDVLPEPAYTFGHVVIDDYNFDNSTIDYCLAWAEEWREDRYRDVRWVDITHPDPSADLMDWGGQFLDDYVEAIEEFLKWLKTLPEEVREQP